MKKVLNISSVHPWSDTRIFFREASSVAANKAYQVIHIAVENNVSTGMETPIDIRFLPKRTKLKRYKNWQLLWYAIKLEQPGIIHMHDPELLLLAWFTKKRLQTTIIYDMHENVPQVVASKQAIPKFLRKPMKWLYQKIEKWLIGSCDGVVFAEEHYKESYAYLTCPTVDVYNYPAIISGNVVPRKQGIFTFVYIGSISKLRGANLMIDLAEQLAMQSKAFQIRVIGAGAEIFEAEAKQRGLSEWIHFEGPKKFSEAFEILQTSHVGLSLLLENANFAGCKPTKCMEYMAAGIPFIVSDFLMQEDLKRYPCGLSADTKHLESVVEQALYLLQNPDVVAAMGDVGFRAYKETYNWQTEEVKLLEFYSHVGGELD